VTSSAEAMPSVEGRARSVRLPRVARRNQLLGAAREVFVAQGYHAAAMDDIAERAGVSKPVLYQHFPGKLELYQQCEIMVDKIRSALDSTHDNKLRVAATMDSYFDFVEHETGAFRLVFESDLNNEPAVRRRVDEAQLECARLISVVIAEDTGLPHEEAMLLAVGLTGISQITARYWLSSGSPVSREKASELISQLAWRGIAKFPLGRETGK
jgi:AcrR family transcriptional regulator